MSPDDHVDPEAIPLNGLGDLILEFGPHRVPYKACSQTLARASSVFKSMLYGGYAESRPKTGDWVIVLPEDSIVGFHILLDIANGNMKKNPREHMDIPDKINYPQDQPPHTATEILYHVAMTAEKYDMVHLLQPWINEWCDEVRLYTHPRADWLGERLWIAWILGHEGILKDELQAIALSAYLVEICETDESNQEDAAKDNRDGDNGAKGIAGKDPASASGKRKALNLEDRENEEVPATKNRHIDTGLKDYSANRDDSDNPDLVGSDTARGTNTAENTAQQGYTHPKCRSKAHGRLMLAARNKRGKDVVLDYPDTDENMIFGILQISGMFPFGWGDLVVSS